MVWFVLWLFGVFCGYLFVRGVDKVQDAFDDWEKDINEY